MERRFVQTAQKGETKYNMELSQITFGSDPEFPFIEKATGNLVAASEVLNTFQVLEGIKDGDEFFISKDEESALYRWSSKNVVIGDKTYKTIYLSPIESNRGQTLPAFVVDGAAIEINLPPTNCISTFVTRMANSLSILQRIVDRVTEWKELEISVTPVATFTEEALKKLPLIATVFGCDPDTDIYNNAIEKVTVDASEHLLRYFGGHIHISMEGLEDPLQWFADNIQNIGCMLDRIVGVASVALTENELETTRRSMYGQAGRMRIQPYGGIEYRTPSNFWTINPEVTKYILELTRIAYTVAGNPDLVAKLEELYPLDIILRVINFGEPELAQQVLMDTLGILNENMSTNIPKLALYSLDLIEAGGVYNKYASEFQQSWKIDQFFHSYTDFLL